jgi:hypothetical protein
MIKSKEDVEGYDNATLSSTKAENFLTTEATLNFQEIPSTKKVQLGDHELASGDWREGEVLFPL